MTGDHEVSARSHGTDVAEFDSHRGGQPRRCFISTRICWCSELGITTLVLLGQVLELRARSRTSSAIRSLLELAPKTALVIDSSGQEREVPLAHVHVGDRLRVRPGERVPVDGEVIEGATFIDESMITGEPVPVGRRSVAAPSAGPSTPPERW